MCPSLSPDIQCNRGVHALRGIIGNQGKFTKKQSGKNKCFSVYFRSGFTFGDETYTVGEETPRFTSVIESIE